MSKESKEITRKMLETYTITRGRFHRDLKTAELEFEFELESSDKESPLLRVFTTLTYNDEFLTRIHSEKDGFIMKEGVRVNLREKINEMLLHMVYRGIELALRRQEG